MKKLLFAFIGITITTLAFSQDVKKPAKTLVDKCLPGTWVVENKTLLPAAEAVKHEFMKDSLVFLPGNQFKNGFRANLPAGIYNYESNEGLLMIFTADMEGMAYEVVEITENRLVVYVANAAKTELVRLVYNKVLLKSVPPQN